MRKKKTTQADIERENEGRFTVYIRTEDDAFVEYPKTEVSRILREIADRLATGEDDFSFFRTLLDRNGNDVGRAKMFPNAAEKERQAERRRIGQAQWQERVRNAKQEGE